MHLCTYICLDCESFDVLPCSKSAISVLFNNAPSLLSKFSFQVKLLLIAILVMFYLIIILCAGVQCWKRS